MPVGGLFPGSVRLSRRGIVGAVHLGFVRFVLHCSARSRIRSEAWICRDPLREKAIAVCRREPQIRSCANFMPMKVHYRPHGACAMLPASPCGCRGALVAQLASPLTGT